MGEDKKEMDMIKDCQKKSGCENMYPWGCGGPLGGYCDYYKEFAREVSND